MPTPLQTAEKMIALSAKGMGIPGRITLSSNYVTCSVTCTYHGIGPSVSRSFDPPGDVGELGDMTIAVMEWVRGVVGLPTLEQLTKETA